MIKVMVTGGSGYIGSHIVKVFSEYGYEVISVDLKEKKWNDYNIKSYKGDIRDIRFLTEIFALETPIAGIIHCAGELGIERSYRESRKFYENNVLATDNILNMLVRYEIKNFIFASSAAVYPVNKTSVKENIIIEDASSPYAKSKLICEKHINQLKQYYDFHYIILRYFNVIGCDVTDDESVIEYMQKKNIVPQLVLSANENIPINVYGCQYDTMDGTCVRDYIDIWDLAYLHLKIFNQLIQNSEVHSLSGIYNAGTGKGYSVLEIIKAFEKNINKKMQIKFASERKGDSNYLCADMIKTFSTFGHYNMKNISEVLLDLWQHNKKR